MKSFFSLSIFLLVFGFGGTIEDIKSENELGQIVPGIHQENLPSPIFYEGYVPILLEFQTPKWNKTDITFNNWYNCSSENYPYSLSCPVTFHLNKIVENLHVDFEGLHPAVDKSTDETQELAEIHYDLLTSSSEFCSKIQTHFNSIYSNVSDSEKYLRALKRCSIVEWGNEVEALFQRNISDYNYPIAPPFYQMERNFYSIFYTKIYDANTTNSSEKIPQKVNLISSAILGNQRTTLQMGLLDFFYAEKNRWVHGISDCLRGIIPHSLVTKDKLQQNLDAILKLKSFKDFELSVNPSLLSKYYTLPIADCSYTSDGNFLVRIQVPIVKKDRPKSLQLVHVHTIPFESDGHVCRVKLNSQADHFSSGGFYQEVHGSRYIFEELVGQAFPTDCKSNKICKISEYGLSTKSNTDRCVSALLSRNHSVIRNHCQLQCRKQDLSSNPLVMRTHSNQYVVTGSPSEIKIKCYVKKWKSVEEWNTTYLYTLTGSRIGAHLINFPPNCSMTISSSEKLKKIRFFSEIVDEFPPSKPEIIPIIPFHFAKVLHHNHSHDSEPFDYEKLSPDSKVNLADFVDLERIKSYVAASRGNKGVEESDKINGADALNQVLDSSSSITALWVVFVITTLLILMLQAYILYVLKRNRVYYARDDRILYKVPDSPVLY